MKTSAIKYCVIAAAAVVLFGCSKLKDEKAPTQPVVSVHGEGFADPASTNFHGVFIKEHRYDLQLCKQCHGAEYDGGTAGKSCLTCHTKAGGPENCTTCHGSVNAAPPRDLSGNTSPTFRGVGAHQKHLLGGVFGIKISCSQCHSVPATVSAAGHIDTTLHAEVHLDTTSVLFGKTALYDPASNSCANTYCHGNFANGNAKTMTWTDTSETAAACGSCHGDVTKPTLAEKALPKTVTAGGTHPDVDLSQHTCSYCHGKVINSSMEFVDLSKHINGKVD